MIIIIFKICVCIFFIKLTLFVLYRLKKKILKKILNIYIKINFLKQIYFKVNKNIRIQYTQFQDL